MPFSEVSNWNNFTALMELFLIYSGEGESSFRYLRFILSFYDSLAFPVKILLAWFTVQIQYNPCKYNCTDWTLLVTTTHWSSSNFQLLMNFSFLDQTNFATTDNLAAACTWCYAEINKKTTVVF